MRVPTPAPVARPRRRYNTTPAAQVERHTRQMFTKARQQLATVGIFDPEQLKAFGAWTDLLAVGTPDAFLTQKVARFIWVVWTSGDPDAIGRLFGVDSVVPPAVEPLTDLEVTVLKLRWDTLGMGISEIARTLGMEWRTARDLIMSATIRLLARMLYQLDHEVPEAVLSQIVDLSPYGARAMHAACIECGVEGYKVDDRVPQAGLDAVRALRGK